MSSVQRFEDLAVWKKARELTKTIYFLTNQGDFARDSGLKDQIRRSSVSIMANIAEGFIRRSDRDFLHFLNISRSSAAEVKSHLYVALDQGYVREESFREAFSELEEISKMIYGLVKHLRKP